jgi:hypothetical protein
LKNLLEFRSQWQTEPIPKEDRITNLHKALSFWNNKGAGSQLKLFFKLVSGDVVVGFGLPLPLSKTTRLSGAYMAPLNIQPQWTISKCSKIVEKDRLTHNQSFK